jgi:hypothetical protein
MKSFVSICLIYLETAIISLVTGGLILISISGITYDAIGQILAISAILMLIWITIVSLKRRQVLDENDHFNGKDFKEIRVFIIESKIMLKKIIRYNPLTGMIQYAPLVIVLGAFVVLFSAFASSAEHTRERHERETLFRLNQEKLLTPNEAIVEAAPGYPATLFNKSLIIDVLKLSGGLHPRVTAVIKSNGLQDMAIDNELEGYETTFMGNNQFKVQINRIDSSSVHLYVKRLTDQ